MAFFLGVDAGGTKTTAALAEDDRIVARATGGSIKVMRVAPEKAEEHLRSILADLTSQTGVQPAQFASACVGIAGNGVGAVNGWVWKTLGPLLQGDLDVCCDTDIALDAAFPGEAGVLVIAGTGSNILGRTRSGQLVNVGGWGPMLGDEGSGHWIGLRAVRAALRAHDRGEPTPLLSAIAAYWKFDMLDQLVEIAHAHPAPDFAALARLVVEQAEAGDNLAQSVLRDAGKALAEDAALALDKMHALDPEAPRRLAFVGSVLERIEQVRTVMIDELLWVRPGVQVLPHAVDPVDGALWRARRLASEPA